jgi:hypothetical protein
MMHDFLIGHWFLSALWFRVRLFDVHGKRAAELGLLLLCRTPHQAMVFAWGHGGN